MGDDYIDPPADARRRQFFFWSIFAVVWMLLFVLSMQLRPFAAYVGALPVCEQMPWWRGMTVAGSALLLAMAIFAMVFLVKLSRHRQFPFPRTVVWRRTRIRRGAILVICALPFFAIAITSGYLLFQIATSSVVEGLFFHECNGA